jgi:hypothetical protein
MSLTGSVAALLLSAAVTHRVDANGYLDKVTVRYHGAFATSVDGAWKGWAEGVPSRGAAALELYPDVREYAAQDLAATRLAPLGNGAKAELFSSYSPRVIDTHFRWMEENGIDGVGLDRRLADLDDAQALLHRNAMTSAVRTAAEAHGRVFYISYDLDGLAEKGWLKRVQQDWTHVLKGELKLTDSASYVREGGRPVVVLGHFGALNSPGTAAQAMDIVDWFHSQGCYVVGAVPMGWRTGEGTKKSFLAAYSRLDAVQPDVVGAFADERGAEQFVESFVKADRAFAARLGIAYQQVLFPGAAASNTKGTARNAAPRAAGRLFWTQAYLAKANHLPVVIAGFDSYGEGTAIAKAAENTSMTPADQYFLTLDADGQALSSDFYLRLTGAATRMLEGGESVRDVPVPWRTGDAR